MTEKLQNRKRIIEELIQMLLNDDDGSCHEIMSEKMHVESRELRKGAKQREGVYVHPISGVRLVKCAKACELLGLSQAALCKLTRAGKIRYYRPARNIYYYEADIMDYVKRSI